MSGLKPSSFICFITLRIETGAYPQTLNEVRSRIPPDIRGRLERRDPNQLMDPWNRLYVYIFNPSQPETYVLFSQGAKADIEEDNILPGK